MKNVCAAAPQLANLEPYDPKYLPAQAMISANESPYDIPVDIRAEISASLAQLPFNRDPDPLANELRDMIAQANNLAREQVLLGNGGDELLFNLALAWGGEGRKMLNITPTFSVYEFNAVLNNTEVVTIPRKPNLSIDEDAVIARLSQGDISYVIITSPNNPTGSLASLEFIERAANASNALVLVDEAYGEFAGQTALPLLKEHKNLLILHTFSKAFSFAGGRLGYFLGNEEVIREFAKFRQPYSVDALSQAIGKVLFAHRDYFLAQAANIMREQQRVMAALCEQPGIETVYPSDANFILFKLERAGEVWAALYEKGVLVRDFSRAKGSENCLRVSIGSPEENNLFLQALAEVLGSAQRAS